MNTRKANMSFFLRTSLIAVAALSSLRGQPASQGLPPLIDRQLLFGDPEIVGAELSPDGRYLAFIKPWKSTRNIWVKTIDEPFSAARLLTTETKRPIPAFLWTRDGKYVVYVKDTEGDENFNAFAVDPAAAPPPGADAPPSRDLTGLKGVQIALYAAPKNDPDIVYIGLNDRDKAWHDLYKLKISTGERTLMRKNTERIAGWTFDLQGQLRLAFRVADNGDQELLRVDPGGFTKVYSCTVFESCGPVRFQKDGKRFYMETNKGDDANLTSLVLFDPQTEKVEKVESDPLNKVDVGETLFSEATDELVLTTYTGERTRRYFKDKKLEADYQWLQKRLPGLEVELGSHTKDDRIWLVSANGDTEPGVTYLFDRGTHKLALQYKVREKLPREALAPMKAIAFKSSDGLEIPAYLTLPKGVPAKGLPTIVVPHGGPWYRDYWGYNPIAQFLANRGYAVLMPNFRGSTGYGKKFLNAGNGEWGVKMQDDITWGMKHLVAEGIADPKRLGIVGGSYGGYATLAGVAFTPDLYRAAVDIVGPSNLISLLESIPPYWEAGRKIMYARMADPGTPQGKARLQAESPLNKASDIKTPLLVVQGANDPRVNRRESEQIVIALRDRGFPVEYLLAPDEGHGFARPVNSMAMFMATEKFFAQYLDGRYQKDGTPEVVARLKEIAVDPKTVTTSKIADAGQVGVPTVAVAMQPGVWKYKASIEMAGQKIAIAETTTIQEENGAWTVSDALDTPMGKVVDTATLEKGTLVLRKRSVTQGPLSIDIAVDGGKLSGSMNMNGKQTPISADLGGPLFAETAGPQCIALLPLADGYTTTFRNFDLQKQKVKLIALKMAGSESVTVPAGTFDTFKVVLSSADGGSENVTLWIAKDPRKAVKVVAVMAEMGGATMTAELDQQP
jgi:dipeptidyl aminopeptidase/acylaminoacyl peptidase